MDFIHVYTRAQALADGVLVDVSELAMEAGFTCSVALTAGAYDSHVRWSERDKSQAYQDESGRLWDVVFMASMAIQRAPKSASGRMSYQLYSIPRDGRSTEPQLTTLDIVAGPDDNGALCLTIMLPSED